MVREPGEVIRGGAGAVVSTMIARGAVDRDGSVENGATCEAVIVCGPFGTGRLRTHPQTPDPSAGKEQVEPVSARTVTVAPG